MYLKSCMTAFALLSTLASAQALPVAAERRAIPANPPVELVVDAQAAIDYMNARIAATVRNVTFAADGRLESIDYLGKTIRAHSAGSQLTGFEVDGKRYRLQSSLATAAHPVASVLIVDADSGRPLVVLDAARSPVIGSAFPASVVQSLPPSAHSVDEAVATIKAAEADAEMATLARLIAAGKAKKLCQDSTDCDGVKELTMAGCDDAFDQASALSQALLGGGTVVGAIVGGIPGAVVGAGGAGAVAALIISNAGSVRLACKSRALSDWATCKNSC